MAQILVEAKLEEYVDDLTSKFFRSDAEGGEAKRSVSTKCTKTWCGTDIERSCLNWPSDNRAVSRHFSEVNILVKGGRRRQTDEASQLKKAAKKWKGSDSAGNSLNGVNHAYRASYTIINMTAAIMSEIILASEDVMTTPTEDRKIVSVEVCDVYSLSPVWEKKGSHFYSSTCQVPVGSHHRLQNWERIYFSFEPSSENLWPLNKFSFCTNTMWHHPNDCIEFFQPSSFQSNF